MPRALKYIKKILNYYGKGKHKYIYRGIIVQLTKKGSKKGKAVVGVKKSVGKTGRKPYRTAIAVKVYGSKSRKGVTKSSMKRIKKVMKKRRIKAQSTGYTSRSGGIQEFHY